MSRLTEEPDGGNLPWEHALIRDHKFVNHAKRDSSFPQKGFTEDRKFDIFVLGSDVFQTERQARWSEMKEPGSGG